jgi:hypothetical protein
MNVSHPSKITPDWKSDCAGNFQGDTLVFDTKARRTLQNGIAILFA